MGFKELFFIYDSIVNSYRCRWEKSGTHVNHLFADWRKWLRDLSTYLTTDWLIDWLTDKVNNWEDSLIVDRTSPFSVDKKSTMYTLLLSSMIPRNPVVHFCNWVYLILLSFETWFESTASLSDQKKSLSK